MRGTAGNHAFYLAIPPGLLRRRRRPAQGARARAARAGLVAPRRRGEAVRARRGVGARAQQHAGRGLPVRLDLPDRPLPRQGDGPEHPGAALRERDVRADLELQLRRPRADHDGRGHRHRRPGRLLRRHRRRPRRDPEPPDAADVAGGDGGAHVVRGRGPAHREAQAALGREPPAPARPHHRTRSVRRGLAGRREGRRLPRGGGRPQDLRHRDVRRGDPPRRQPPLGRRAVLPAHRQAARPARHRGRRSSSSPPRTCRSPRTRPRSSPTTRW